MTVTIIRLILSFVLIYLVYTETGVFTALFAALVLATVEIQNFTIKKIIESIKILGGIDKK